MDESATTDEQNATSDSGTGDEAGPTVQRRIIDLYESETLPKTAVGLWAKLLVEFVVVAVPVVLFGLLPGVIAADLGIHPAITLPNVVAVAGGFAVAVTEIVWCFTAEIDDE